MRTKFVINLFGGSGIGKSTSAAKLYFEMKTLGYDVEIVREYIKEWIQEGKNVGHFGQIIAYGEQVRRQTVLYNSVEYIITDSPLLLNPIYQKHYFKHDPIKEQALYDYKLTEDLGIKHINLLLTRKTVFNPKDRFETEEQAKLMDFKIKCFLEENKIPYTQIDEITKILNHF